MTERKEATIKIRSWSSSNHPGNCSVDPPLDGLLRLPDTAPVEFEYRVVSVDTICDLRIFNGYSLTVGNLIDTYSNYSSRLTVNATTRRILMLC